MIHKIKIENICTIESVELNLTDKKLAVFVGSSGSGKTSIVGALIAALYGSFPDKPDISLYGDVIDHDKLALIEIELDLFGDRYRIERTINAKEQKSLTYIYKDKELIIGPQAAGVKAWIESNIMDKNSFLSLYYLSQKEKNDICSLNPSAGMSVLLELFGLDKLSSYATKYSSMIKSQTTTLNSLQNECSAIRESVGKIAEYTSQLDNYKSEIKNKKSSLTSCEKRRKQSETQDIQKKQNLSNILQQTKMKLTGEINGDKKLLEATNSALKNLDKAGCKTNEGFAFPKCPLLNADVLLSKKDELTKSIKDLEAKLKSTEEEILAASKIVSKEDNETLKIELEYKKLQDELMSLNKALGHAENELNRHQEIVKKETSVLKQIQSIQTQIKYMDFLKSAFSKEGIPALIIDAAIPKINELCNKICHDFYVPFKFRISSVKEQKSGGSVDQLNIMLVDENDKLRHISSFSGGEMQLAQIILRFAIQDFLTESFGITPFDVFIGDEIWSAQDSNLRDITFKMILSRENFSQTLLITHNHDIKFDFDILVETYKENGLTKINVS